MKSLLSIQKTFILLCLFASISSLFWACKKEKGEDPKPPTEKVQLLLSVTETAPYQFIKIQLPAGSKPLNVNAVSVALKINAISADAYPDKAQLANNVYVFHLFVPELAVGNHKISLAIADNKVAEATLKITSFTKIADPVSYIQNHQNTWQQEITAARQKYDSQVLAGHMLPSTADSLKKSLQQAFSNSKDLVTQLSETEKKIYVQLVETNKGWLTEYKQVMKNNPVIGRSTAIGDCEQMRKNALQYASWGASYEANNETILANDCELKRTNERVEATNKYVQRIEAAAIAAKGEYAKRNYKIFGAYAFVTTFCSEAYGGIKEQIKEDTDLEKLVFPMKVEDFTNRITAAEFEVDKEYDYGMGVTFTNVSRENAGKSSDFGAVINGIDYFNNSMNFLGEFFPSVGKMTIPATKTEKVYLSDYTIDQISDPRISVLLKKGGKGKLIKFLLSTAVVVENINFTFRVSYSSRFGNISKVISATLHQPIDKILVSVSPWKITRNIQGGIDQFTMHEIWRWKCNNVEYINREQLLEASLSFQDGGSGQSYEKYHEIYYENKTAGVCDINKVDQQKGYGGSFTWSYNKTSKTMTAHFTNDRGEKKNLISAVSIQNETLTLTSTEVTLVMQKK